MLPFATNTDLNEAAKKADVGHESRNGFLQKLLGEHSIIEARQQLKELWGKWIETNYGAAGPESTGRGYDAEAVTPEDSDDDAGVDGSQSPNLRLQGQLLQRSRQLLRRRLLQRRLSRLLRRRLSQQLSADRPESSRMLLRKNEHQWHKMESFLLVTSHYYRLLMITAQ
jgi:hypothetical protein